MGIINENVKVCGKLTRWSIPEFWPTVDPHPGLIPAMGVDCAVEGPEPVDPVKK